MSRNEERNSRVLSDDRIVAAEFWSLLKGADLKTIAKLMNAETLSNNVYFYDHASKSAVRATPSELPWPVALLLGGFQ